MGGRVGVSSNGFFDALVALMGQVMRTEDVDELSFETQIRPILIERCHECHGRSKKRSGLRVDSRNQRNTGRRRRQRDSLERKGLYGMFESRQFPGAGARSFRRRENRGNIWYRSFRPGKPLSARRSTPQRASLVLTKRSRGDLAYGPTDEYGIQVAADPVHVHDYRATILHLPGIDHEQLTYRYARRVVQENLT